MYFQENYIQNFKIAGTLSIYYNRRIRKLLKESTVLGEILQNCNGKIQKNL